MNQYETVFILTPVLSDEQMKEAVKKFEDILTKNGQSVGVLCSYSSIAYCRKYNRQISPVWRVHFPVSHVHPSYLTAVFLHFCTVP